MKKIIVFTLTVCILMLFSFSVSAALEAYTLCDNSTYNSSKEGIHQGWTSDNRGGSLTATILKDYNLLEDIDPSRSSSMYRDLNMTNEGVVTLETGFTIMGNFNGLSLVFTDAYGNETYTLSTINNTISVKQKNGSYRKLLDTSDIGKTYHVLVTLDFESGESHTVIDETDCGTDSLLSDSISRFSFETSDEALMNVSLYPTRITANYAVYDNFDFYTSSSKQYPYGITFSSDSTAYVSSSQAVVTENGYMEREFDSVSGTIAFDGMFYVPSEGNGKITLLDENNNALEIVLGQEDITYGSNTIYSDYLHDFWYRFRVEADLSKNTVIFKINGREILKTTLPKNFASVTKYRLSSEAGNIKFDTLRLYNIVEHTDYVKKPLIPADSSNSIVGINVCSLWDPSTVHGWHVITPYDEYRPVLGYYDEGNPETADWEIKYMVEHGIDFQAFCWYAEHANAPIKQPEFSNHLHNGFMNAKYSSSMKYCLLWEAAAGANPTSLSAFKNYFVPYWTENYFKDSRYLVIDNKPVLMCFSFNNFVNTIGGKDVAKSALDYLREEIKALGFDDLIFIVCHAKDNEEFAEMGVDGVYAYNWGIDGSSAEHNINKNIEWANVGATRMIPTVSVGFNSLPWHGKRYKNITPEDFKTALEWVRDEYFDLYPAEEPWQDKLVMLSTWNEYGEGTYIMPCEDLHGFGYLDALREVFTDNTNTLNTNSDAPIDVSDLFASVMSSEETHKDLIPTNNQLARITKNYPQHIRLLRRLDNYSVDEEKSLLNSKTVTPFDKLHFFVQNASNISYESAISGTTKSASVNSLAYVETKDLFSVNLSGYSHFKFRMSLSSASTVKVYYATADTPYYTQDSYFEFSVPAGSISDYYVKIPNALSGKTLAKLRIYPSEAKSVSFAFEDIAVCSNGMVFIDDYPVKASVCSELINGKMYYPFDPLKAMGYIMNVHFEWDKDAEKLTLYGPDDKYISFAAGSDEAKTSDGNISLDIPVYLSDGLPMLDMTAVCEAFGYDYAFDGYNLFIRTEAYEKHKNALNHPENEWDFSKGVTYAWKAENAFMYPASDSLYVEGMANNDTRITSTGLSLDAGKYKEIEISVSYNNISSSETFKVYFITDTSTSWSGSKCYAYRYGNTSSNGEYITIKYDLSSNSAWKDTVTAIRFDPFERIGSKCNIKYIKLIEKDNISEGNKPFTSVTLDAEDGKLPFESENSSFSIVEDPTDSSNHVYFVNPDAPSIFTCLDYNMLFEPGATYSVSFDILAGTVYADPEMSTEIPAFINVRYDHPGNSDDHPIAITQLETNSLEWYHFSKSFTVDKSSTVRLKTLSNGMHETDEFRIYFNRETTLSSSVSFYVDNITITKTTVAELSILRVSKNNNGSVTVTGFVGKDYDSNTSVACALYDTNGRFVKMVVADGGNWGSYTATIPGAVSGTIKVFAFRGFDSFMPLDNHLERTIEI